MTDSIQILVQEALDKLEYGSNKDVSTDIREMLYTEINTKYNLNINRFKRDSFIFTPSQINHIVDVVCSHIGDKPLYKLYPIILESLYLANTIVEKLEIYMLTTDLVAAYIMAFIKLPYEKQLELCNSIYYMPEYMEDYEANALQVCDMAVDMKVKHTISKENFQICKDTYNKVVTTDIEDMIDKETHPFADKVKLKHEAKRNLDRMKIDYMYIICQSSVLSDYAQRRIELDEIAQSENLKSRLADFMIKHRETKN